MNPKLLGKLGENYACEFLIKQGYIILMRNFYSRNFEIDIVATKEEKLVFIEVKTREDFEHYEQHMAISKFKIYKIKRGIGEFLSRNIFYSSLEIHINGLIVLINPYNKLPKFVFYDCLD